MARLATTTADPVEGAVLHTECSCAADRAVNRLVVVPHATLKASVANRRRDIIKNRHFHQMSAVKDIRKGLMMGSDRRNELRQKGIEKHELKRRNLTREVWEVEPNGLDLD